MHKRISILFLALSFGLFAQEYNQEISMPNGQYFLLGKINEEGLKGTHYQNWYTANYKAYEPNKPLVKKIKKKLKGYQIKIFLGTWCGDSKREVPRFLKILSKTEFPKEHLEIVALDKRKGKRKTSPEGFEKGLNIKRVPTFIFLKKGKEVNRIVEYPIANLETDMLKILNGEVYIPNYTTASK